MVIEEKLSIMEAAHRLSLAPSTRAYWVKTYNEGKIGDIGNGQRPLAEVEMELARRK